MHRIALGRIYALLIILLLSISPVAGAACLTPGAATEYLNEQLEALSPYESAEIIYSDGTSTDIQKETKEAVIEDIKNRLVYWTLIEAKHDAITSFLGYSTAAELKQLYDRLNLVDTKKHDAFLTEVIERSAEKHLSGMEDTTDTPSQTVQKAVLKDYMEYLDRMIEVKTIGYDVIGFAGSESISSIYPDTKSPLGNLIISDGKKKYVIKPSMTPERYVEVYKTLQKQYEDIKQEMADIRDKIYKITDDESKKEELSGLQKEYEKAKQKRITIISVIGMSRIMLDSGKKERFAAVVINSLASKLGVDVTVPSVESKKIAGTDYILSEYIPGLNPLNDDQFRSLQNYYSKETASTSRFFTDMSDDDVKRYTFLKLITLILGNGDAHLADFLTTAQGKMYAIDNEGIIAEIYGSAGTNGALFSSDKYYDSQRDELIEITDDTVLMADFIDTASKIDYDTYAMQEGFSSAEAALIKDYIDDNIRHVNENYATISRYFKTTEINLDTDIVINNEEFQSDLSIAQAKLKSFIEMPWYRRAYLQITSGVSKNKLMADVASADYYARMDALVSARIKDAERFKTGATEVSDSGDVIIYAQVPMADSTSGKLLGGYIPNKGIFIDVGKSLENALNGEPIQKRLAAYKETASHETMHAYLDQITDWRVFLNGFITESPYFNDAKKTFLRKYSYYDEKQDWVIAEEMIVKYFAADYRNKYVEKYKQQTNPPTQSGFDMTSIDDFMQDFMINAPILSALMPLLEQDYSIMKKSLGDQAKPLRLTYEIAKEMQSDGAISFSAVTTEKLELKGSSMISPEKSEIPGLKIDQMLLKTTDGARYIVSSESDESMKRERLVSLLGNDRANVVETYVVTAETAVDSDLGKWMKTNGHKKIILKRAAQDYVDMNLPSNTYSLETLCALYMLVQDYDHFPEIEQNVIEISPGIYVSFDHELALSGTLAEHSKNSKVPADSFFTFVDGPEFNTVALANLYSRFLYYSDYGLDKLSITKLQSMVKKAGITTDAKTKNDLVNLLTLHGKILEAGFTKTEAKKVLGTLLGSQANLMDNLENLVEVQTGFPIMFNLHKDETFADVSEDVIPKTIITERDNQPIQSDQGALIDFSLGTIDAGQSKYDILLTPGTSVTERAVEAMISINLQKIAFYQNQFVKKIDQFVQSNMLVDSIDSKIMAEKAIADGIETEEEQKVRLAKPLSIVSAFFRKVDFKPDENVITSMAAHEFGHAMFPDLLDTKDHTDAEISAFLHEIYNADPHLAIAETIQSVGASVAGSSKSDPHGDASKIIFQGYINNMRSQQGFFKKMTTGISNLLFGTYNTKRMSYKQFDRLIRNQWVVKWFNDQTEDDLKKIALDMHKNRFGKNIMPLTDDQKQMISKLIAEAYLQEDLPLGPAIDLSGITVYDSTSEEAKTFYILQSVVDYDTIKLIKTRDGKYYVMKSVTADEAANEKLSWMIAQVTHANVADIIILNKDDLSDGQMKQSMLTDWIVLSCVVQTMDPMEMVDIGEDSSLESILVHLAATKDYDHTLIHNLGKISDGKTYAAYDFNMAFSEYFDGEVNLASIASKVDPNKLESKIKEYESIPYSTFKIYADHTSSKDKISKEKLEQLLDGQKNLRKNLNTIFKNAGKQYMDPVRLQSNTAINIDKPDLPLALLSADAKSEHIEDARIVFPDESKNFQEDVADALDECEVCSYPCKITLELIDEVEKRLKEFFSDAEFKGISKEDIAKLEAELRDDLSTLKQYLDHNDQNAALDSLSRILKRTDLDYETETALKDLQTQMIKVQTNTAALAAGLNPADTPVEVLKANVDSVGRPNAVLKKILIGDPAHPLIDDVVIDTSSFPEFRYINSLIGESDYIALSTRSLPYDDVILNEHFSTNMNLQKLGIASYLYASENRLADALGIRKINIPMAVGAGRISWADREKGFYFTELTKAELASDAGLLARQVLEDWTTERKITAAIGDYDLTFDGIDNNKPRTPDDWKRRILDTFDKEPGLFAKGTTKIGLESHFNVIFNKNLDKAIRDDSAKNLIGALSASPSLLPRGFLTMTKKVVSFTKDVGVVDDTELKKRQTQAIQTYDSGDKSGLEKIIKDNLGPEKTKSQADNFMIEIAKKASQTKMMPLVTELNGILQRSYSSSELLDASKIDRLRTLDEEIAKAFLDVSDVQKAILRNEWEKRKFAQQLAIDVKSQDARLKLKEILSEIQFEISDPEALNKIYTYITSKSEQTSILTDLGLEMDTDKLREIRNNIQSMMKATGSDVLKTAQKELAAAS